MKVTIEELEAYLFDNYRNGGIAIIDEDGDPCLLLKICFEE